MKPSDDIARWRIRIFSKLMLTTLVLGTVTAIPSSLFALPDATRVWPGHDYKGQSVTTISWEKRHNARLAGRSRDEFIALMAALDLPKPKMIDVALPANRKLGLVA